MIEPERWIDRTWTFDFPASRFPNLIERVRGTPARAGELAATVSEEALSQRVGGSWSAKEHIAHLDDLHDLDIKRLDEFTSGAAELSPADMTNARTESALHNHTSIRTILDGFRGHREEFARDLESLSEAAVGVALLHPRLGQKLRLVDWVYFVAEHDDHHLARARWTLARVREPGL